LKITLNNIEKSFYQKSSTDTIKVEVLKNFSLEILDGEFFTLFGPNGCGKTTLLKIIAGLEPVDAGDVLIEEYDKHRIGYIFQNYKDSLLPWRKTVDNIALPLEIQGVPSKERQKTVENLLDELQIELPLFAYPYQLSAGQQQLISIVRALAFNAEILLFDEPFSSLDHDTRQFLQGEISRIWEKTHKTILFISHDIEEAIILASRMALLSKKPCKILKELNIGLGRPRNREMVRTQEFFEIKRTALEFISSERKT
jgi:NitT/TauT family transport system ATP-binding protein